MLCSAVSLDSPCGGWIVGSKCGEKAEGARLIATSIEWNGWSRVEAASFDGGTGRQWTNNTCLDWRQSQCREMLK